MKIKLLLLPAAAMALAVLSTSCSTLPLTDLDEDPRLQRELDDEVNYTPEGVYSYWEDDGATGPLRVSIDLSEQTAYIYRGDTQVGRSRVATGRAGHRTPTGSFTIMEKIADKRSNLYGRILDSDGSVAIRDADSRKHSVPPGGRFLGAPMPYWMRLTSHGIGMHVGPIPNPGRPASHGCIRMPRRMATLLFENSTVGTPVTIVP